MSEVQQQPLPLERASHAGWFRCEEQALRKIADSFDKPCDARNATAAYVTLCRKANLKGAESFEDTVGSMASDLHMAYRDAQKALALVEAIGLVRIERRKLPGTSGNAPSIYTLVRLSEPYDAMSRPSDITSEPSRKDRVHDESRTFPNNSPKNISNNSPKKEARPNSQDEIRDYLLAIGLSGIDPVSDAEYYWLHWQENGFTNGGKPIKSWKMTLSKWKSSGFLPSQKRNSNHVIGNGTARTYAPVGDKWEKT